MTRNAPVLPIWIRLAVVWGAMQGVAHAAGALDALGGFAKYLQDPTEWLKKFWDLMKGAQVPELALVAAGTILLFGVVWTGYRIAAGTHTGESPYLFLIRLCVAGFLVFPGSAAEVTRYVRDSWAGSMAWGFQKFAAPTVTEAGTAMKDIIDHATNVGSLALTVGGIGAAAKAAQAGATGIKIAGAAGSGTFKAAAGVTNATKAVGFLAMPIFMTYYVVVLVTGFAVLMSSILLPMSGAMLIFPGHMGTEWFGRWLKTTISALFLVAFMPLVFAAALNIGFIAPAKAYTENFKAAQADISAAWNKSIPNPLTDPQGAISVIGEKIWTVVQAGFDMIVNFVLGFLMMLIGIIAGVAVINNAYSQITAFIGGAISAAGAAGSGAALAGALRGMASAASRGGGSPSGSGRASASAPPASAPSTGGPAEGGTAPQTTFRTSGGSGGSVGGSSRPSGMGYGSSNLQTGGDSSSPRGPSGNSFGSARPRNT